ncbi:hypothetical protein J6590_091128 [Homalodisca vitripennis]|nr:hypothetical protein J6590_091128 [Homalodisca vitripennis]
MYDYSTYRLSNGCAQIRQQEQERNRDYGTTEETTEEIREYNRQKLVAVESVSFAHSVTQQPVVLDQSLYPPSGSVSFCK